MNRFQYIIHIDMRYKTIWPILEDSSYYMIVMHIIAQTSLLSILQEILKKKISIHDTSSEVNGFYINGGLFWLDKATRVGLAHLADCTDGDISLVLGTVIIQINSALAKELLS